MIQNVGNKGKNSIPINGTAMSRVCLNETKFIFKILNEIYLISSDTELVLL